MKSLRVYPGSINERFITEAADVLRAGGIIIYPTDTLYALGCSALHARAIEKLCKIKGINPLKETLSVVCADISQASEYAHIDNNAFAIMRRHLPGPFTFILPASTRLPKPFKGRKEVGIRVPDNAITAALATELGHPLLSTSITDACQPDTYTVEPETIELLFEKNADVELMIDGGTGSCRPSAVVSLINSSSPEVIREGPQPFES